MTTLAERLSAVQDRIARACARAGRREGDVRLMAVTKIFPYDVIHEAYELGIREFGENYVQEMAGKAPHVEHLAGARFHLIGHLQSNKTKKAAEMFQSIDTVDSVKLARRLHAEEKPLEAMIEVKLSTEESKSGADERAVADIAAELRASNHLQLTGLMTVPPWSEDPELSRPYFARLRAWAEKLGVRELSMGMSNDLEVAIAEGATWVRVGTALFGRRKPAAPVSEMHA